MLYLHVYWTNLDEDLILVLYKPTCSLQNALKMAGS